MNELIKGHWKKNNNKKETSLQLIHHGVNTKHYNQGPWPKLNGAI